MQLHTQPAHPLFLKYVSDDLIWNLLSKIQKFKAIFAMHWVQFVLRFFRGWRWKHTQISLVWLASGGAKHPSSFHSVFCRWRSWPRLTVVGHGVCGGQKHRLWLWLWSLLSGRALSQALALFGSPGDRRVNYKNLFLCRHAEAGEQGWDGEALVGILERNP